MASLSKLKTLNLEGIPLKDENLASLRQLKDLRVLRFQTAPLTDAALQVLKDLDRLEHLQIRNARIRGHGLKHLHGMKNLRTLDLRENMVGETWEEVSELEQCVNELQGVLPWTTVICWWNADATVGRHLAERIRQLGGRVTVAPTPPVASNGLLGLGRSPTGTDLAEGPVTPATEAGRAANDRADPDLDSFLEEMREDEMQPDDEGVVSGASPLLPLFDIDLSSTKVRDDDLFHVAAFPRMRSLRLFDTRITDRGLAHLMTAEYLEELDLGKTQVTAEGITRLKSLDNLKVLHLDGSPAAVSGVDKLRHELPGVSIMDASK